MFRADFRPYSELTLVYHNTLENNLNNKTS